MANYKNGSIIGVDNTPTKTEASGIWDLRSQRSFKLQDTWPPLLSIVVTYDTIVVDAVNRTTYDLTGFTMTAGDAGKLGVAIVYAFNGAGAPVPDSVSIGGSAATKIIGTTPDATVDSSVSIWAATISGSPTSNVSATFSGSQAAGGAALYLLENASITAHDTAQQNGSSTSSSLSLNTIDKGCTIIGNIQRANGSESGTTISGGITVNAEAALEGGFGLSVAGSRDNDVDATAETVTITFPSTDLFHSVGATFKAV